MSRVARSLLRHARMAHQTPLLARRAPRQDSTGSADRLAVGSVFFGAMLVAAVLTVRALPAVHHPSLNALDLNSEEASRPLVGSKAPALQPTVPAAPTQPPAPPTPTAPAAARLHVAHTDGEGVVLRASPNDRDLTPRGFMDGAAVTVLERSGPDWARVQGDNGQEGWVPARYLEP